MQENAVTIEPELYRRVARFVANTGAFRDVEEYVNFVLEELFGTGEAERADQAEEEMLKERLRQLGYL